MAGAISYEEQRRMMVEANRRKMEELQLHHLSAAVRDAAAPKPSPAKRKRAAPREADEDAPVRRSGRVASLPEKPKYLYEDTYAVFEKKIRRGNRATTSTRKDLLNRVYASDEAREYAINKASALQEKLGSDYPSFVKPMTQSHVTGGFWLGLPLRFCRKYLPKDNEWITLVDEADDEAQTYYLHLKTGLSGGWRGFSIDHGLVDGDCLVFQLLNRTRFKVYIIRQSSYYKKSK